MTGTAVVSTWRRVLRFVGRALLWFCLFLVTLWSTAALYFDVPNHRLRLRRFFMLPASLWRSLCAGLTYGRAFVLSVFDCACLVVIVEALERSSMAARCRANRVDEYRVITLRFTIFGTANMIGIDYTPHWETKNVDLSQIRGVDVFITYWGLRTSRTRL